MNNTKSDLSLKALIDLTLLTFAIFGIDLLLFFIEDMFYTNAEWYLTNIILLHWTIIVVIWSLSGFALIKYARFKYDVNILNSANNTNKISKLQIALIILALIFSQALSYYNWDGFKILIEYNNLGALKFIFQYIYYFAETFLFTLLILFAQKGLELYFKNDKLPYGGFICAITWGLAHIFTKSSVIVGIVSAVYGFMFGCVYMLTNKNFKLTFILLYLMFIS